MFKPWVWIKTHNITKNLAKKKKIYKALYQKKDQTIFIANKS